jgi:cob(I)alamin adenosyltransferase
VSIATRKGDTGSTSLLYGQRVPKDHPQIEAVGAFDELNVEVGAARMAATGARVRRLLLEVQGCLVALMGEVSCAERDAGRHAKSTFARLKESDLARLDEEIGRLESKSLRVDGWATPGANAVSLAFDRARVAARMAERRLCALSPRGRRVRPLLVQWTNRLSDLLWLLARAAEPQARHGGA